MQCQMVLLVAQCSKISTTLVEQLNLFIQYVDDEYVVQDDSVGFFQMPSTNAGTIAAVTKDILTRTALSISLCRGQAYDGAAVMQRK